MVARAVPWCRGVVHTRTLRLLVIAGLVLAPVAFLGPPAQARKHYVVSAKTGSYVLLGQAVRIRGTVSPRAAGKTVVLQKRLRKTEPWRREATARIRRDGTFQVNDRPTTPRARWYRVKKPASRTLGAGYSTSLWVDVSQWHSLTELDPVSAGPGFRKVDPVTIGGVAYEKSLETNASGSIEYDVRRKCTQFVTTFGLTDDSATGAQAEIRAYGDGTDLYHHVFDRGGGLRRHLDLTHVARLRFEVTMLSDLPTYAAIAKPRVLCHF